MSFLCRSSLCCLFLISVLLPFSAQAELFTLSASKNRCLSCHEIHVDMEGDCTYCHRGDRRTSRLEIAHRNLIGAAYASFRDPESLQVVRGREMIKKFGCRRCHVTEGKGNRLAANLDAAIHDRSPIELSFAIREPASYMPDFGLTGPQLIPLVTTLLYGGHVQIEAEPVAERLLLVHFEGKNDGVEQDLFSLNCGACHRVVTASHGGLGRGTMGPELSGLFSEFYPTLVDGREPWTEKNFREWLQNPRSKRPATSMRPVKLEPKDFEKLLQILALPEPILVP